MRVLILRDDNFDDEDPLWIGQGLEHDLCVQGESPDDVRDRMKRQIAYYQGSYRSEFEKLVYLEEIEPAPREFFDMWDDMDTPVIREMIET
jgi:hypothetical protein